MITGPFEEALSKLSKKWNIPLKPDKHNSCLVQFKNGLEIQVEPLNKRDELLICAQLGSLNQGQYREELFKAALIINGQDYPHIGTLGFSTDTNQLILFDHLPFIELTGNKLENLMDPFMEKALKWKEAIKSQSIPAIESKKKATSRREDSPFGLRSPKT